MGTKHFLFYVALLCEEGDTREWQIVVEVVGRNFGHMFSLDVTYETSYVCTFGQHKSLPELLCICVYVCMCVCVYVHIVIWVRYKIAHV